MSCTDADDIVCVDDCDDEGRRNIIGDSSKNNPHTSNTNVNKQTIREYFTRDADLFCPPTCSLCGLFLLPLLLLLFPPATTEVVVLL
mmetsp:Transcript_41609/g.47052  ORF Transcript_41609/g.47052 Transcript_41609/m.47052 type:complete len:87 (+) Transcript_41609:582-842(+)